jgi:N-acetylmuramoyl-L-alanine amidase
MRQSPRLQTWLDNRVQNRLQALGGARALCAGARWLGAGARRLGAGARRLGAVAIRTIVVSVLIALAAPLGPTQAADAPVARDARVGGDLIKTRFVADLSEIVEFRAFTLSDPYRVVIDMPEVNFQMPPALGTQGRGLVSAFRYGLFGEGKSRIVIDVVQPVRIDEAFVQPPANGNPARLILDMVAISPAEFDVSAAQPSVAIGSLGGRETPGEASPTTRMRLAEPLAEPPQADKQRPVIVLDAGHGGIDPGAIGPSGITEKDIVLSFTLDLKARIEAMDRFDVFLTREIDMFIPLAERVNIAHHHNADLFISIHADAVPERYAQFARGATIYTLSEEASDEQAQALAAKENRADLIAGLKLDEQQDEVSMILLDLMRRETKNYSVAFGRTILTKLRDRVVLNSKAHRYANFRVLHAPDIPSVLLELGYLTNPEDEKLLASPEWRAKVAVQVAAAVDSFFSRREVRLPY